MSISFTLTRYAAAQLAFTRPSAIIYRDGNEYRQPLREGNLTVFKRIADLAGKARVVVPLKMHRGTEVLSTFISTKARNELRPPRAKDKYAKDTLETRQRVLSQNFPAVDATLHTELGVSSLCSNCENMFAQMQGQCTPGMPQCHTSLVIPRRSKNAPK